ncbi:hypothetical protein ACFL2H_12520 [Planctomycetota bacterium]
MVKVTTSILLATLGCIAARGDIVQISFVGNVSDVSNADLVPSDISVGSEFSFSLEYDSAWEPDDLPIGQHIYRFDPVGSGVSMSIGRHVFADADDPSGSLIVSDDVNGTDSFRVISLGVDNPSTFGFPISDVTLGLTLADLDGNALHGTALPSSLRLTDFEDARVEITAVHDVAVGMQEPLSYHIVGSISSMSIQSVPEPTLNMLGLASLIVFVRRRR